MHLAVDDRARAPMPSRPSLLGHRSEPLEALGRLIRHSRPGLQCLGWVVGKCAGGGQGASQGIRPGVEGQAAPELWHRGTMTAWHPPPCWAVAEAAQALGPAGPAVQPGHRGQMSAGHLGSCPTRSPNPGRSALFSWAVLGLRLGLRQGGLSRGHSVVVESGPGLHRDCLLP